MPRKTQMNPHQCTDAECTLRFRTKNELYQHQSTVHPMAPPPGSCVRKISQNGPCSCKICGKSFASKQALGGHMSAKHRKSRRPVSRSNGLQRKRFRSMPSTQSLGPQRYSWKHAADRPFVCFVETCTWDFAQKRYLDQHLFNVHKVCTHEHSHFESVGVFSSF